MNHVRNKKYKEENMFGLEIYMKLSASVMKEMQSNLVFLFLARKYKIIVTALKLENYYKIVHRGFLN